MSSLMYHRFAEICPDKRLEDMTSDEVKEDCRIAFLIVGYTPNDLDASFEKAWETSDATELYEYVFDVWLVD